MRSQSRLLPRNKTHITFPPWRIINHNFRKLFPSFLIPFKLRRANFRLANSRCPRPRGLIRVACFVLASHSCYRLRHAHEPIHMRLIIQWFHEMTSSKCYLPTDMVLCMGGSRQHFSAIYCWDVKLHFILVWPKNKTKQKFDNDCWFWTAPHEVRETILCCYIVFLYRIDCFYNCDMIVVVWRGTWVRTSYQSHIP